MARRRLASRRSRTGFISVGAVMGVVLLLAGLGALAVFANRANPAGRTLVQANDEVAAGAGLAVAAPARGVAAYWERLTDLWDATARIQALEAENRGLRIWRELALRMAERNARYESLLRMRPDDFGAAAQIDRGVSAQLVLDSGGPFTRSLVANAGAEHGIAIGHIALNEGGLVGRVVSVGPRTARILMLDDFNARIPVMGESSRVRAIMVGRATAPPDLVAAPFVMLAPGLEFGSADLREGERVITSGDGGLFPRGVPVGLAHRGPNGAWSVILSAAREPLEFVRIVPFAPPTTPEVESAAGAPAPPALPPRRPQPTTAEAGANAAAPISTPPASAAPISAPPPSAPPTQAPSE